MSKRCRSPVVPLASNFLVPNATFLVELIAFAILVWILGEVRHPADQQGDDGAPGGDPQGVRRARRGQGRGRARPRRSTRSSSPTPARGGARSARRRASRARDHRRDARAGPGRGRRGSSSTAHAQIEAERQQAVDLAARRGRHAGHRRWPAASSASRLDDDERSSRVVDRFLADLETLETAETAATNGAR